MKQFFFVGIALSIPIILGGVVLYWFFGGLWAAYSDFRLRRELKEIESESQVRRSKVAAKIPNAESEAEASTKVEEACKKLLANAIVETYTFEIKSIEN